MRASVFSVSVIREGSHCCSGYPVSQFPLLRLLLLLLLLLLLHPPAAAAPADDADEAAVFLAVSPVSAVISVIVCGPLFSTFADSQPYQSCRIVWLPALEEGNSPATLCSILLDLLIKQL